MMQVRIKLEKLYQPGVEGHINRKDLIPSSKELAFSGKNEKAAALAGCM